jgi:hypothetical protein
VLSRPHRAPVLIAVGLVAAMALTGCPGSSGRSPERPAGAKADRVITAAAARELVIEQWAKRRAAYVLNDLRQATTALVAINDGPALRADVDQVALDIRRRTATVKPAKPDRYADLATVNVVVPREQRYPATFLAETDRPVLDPGGKPTGGRIHQVEVYIVRKPRDRWRQLIRIRLADGARMPSVRTTEGWAATAPTDAAKRIAAATDTLRTEIGAGMTRGKLKTGGPVAVSKQLDGILDGYRKWTEYGTHVRLDIRTVVPDTRPPLPGRQAYLTTAGAPLAVVTLPLVSTVKGDDVCATQSDDLHQWGRSLPAGQYRSLTSVEAFVAVVTLPATGAQPITVLGAATPTLRVDGAPC